VAHPLQTQAVTYVVQRFTSLTTLFYLAALVFHIRWRLGREESAPFSSQSVLPFYILSLVSALLAMKSKEIAITLPLAVMLYEVCFVGFPGRRRILEVLPMLLTLVVIPLSTLNISKPLGEILSDVGSATAVQSGLSRWDYLFTQFSVIVKYLRLLLLPVGQNMDYFLDYPLNRSLSEPRALLSLLLLLTLSGSALWMYYRGERRGARGEEIKLQSLDPEIRLAAFGIFWFFLTISLESSIIPIIDVYFEHRVYLPSVGFFIAVAALAVVGVRRFPQTAKVTCALAAVVVVLLSGATIARNQIWRDPVALWQDVKAKAPGNSRAYSNLGKAYSMRKMYHQAAKEYEAALTINPDSAEAFNNLGRTFLDLGQPGEALPLLRQALTLKSEYPAASFNMGLASVAVGNMTDAAEAFAAALRQLPQSYVYRNNLAVVLLKLGRLDEAEQEFRTLLLSRPNDPGIHGPLQEIERLRRTGNRERKYDADRKK
jgi:tetratricopeptide (TPR) repeat protein